ncbi:aspartate carbamoyltransferase [Gardnerella sp. DNF00109]|uniref:aspartate carbamoyltransferase n=1 Tax=Gardnerella sp. DNF00109 TaxID=2749042 RepID=UPI003BB13F35
MTNAFYDSSNQVFSRCAIAQSLANKSVVTLDDISTAQIRMLLDKARYIDEHRKEVAHTCDGRVLATLFYEPSTRTRLSFETAMLRLGGKVIGFAGAQLSSASKGETVSDTLKVVSNYVDVVAMRHPKEGAAFVASHAGSVPVVNAGDGGHMHPTQTLADLATILARFGRLNNLTVGLCGDLTYGRTVHSLIETLCRFGNVHFVLISPDELKTPQYVIDRINDTPSCSYEETHNLMEVIGSLDVLYMTRVQEERFTDREQYLRLRDTYILTEEKLQKAKSYMPVLHPLPRINEIAVDVDDDPRAAYFEQVKNGMLMRMALESSVLGDELPGYEPTDFVNVPKDELEAHDSHGISLANPRVHISDENAPENLICSNSRCITNSELTLKRRFYKAESDRHEYHCLYCDEELQ